LIVGDEAVLANQNPMTLIVGDEVTIANRYQQPWKLKKGITQTSKVQIGGELQVFSKMRKPEAKHRIGEKQTMMIGIIRGSVNLMMRI
jgi:hypothetical protein